MLRPATRILSIPEENTNFSISSEFLTIHSLFAEKTVFRLSGLFKMIPFSQRVIRFFTRRISSDFLRLQPDVTMTSGRIRAEQTRKGTHFKLPVARQSETGRLISLPILSVYLAGEGEVSLIFQLPWCGCH